MQALYDLPAPAKLNLFLHITGRRADGYHLVDSVCMLLDWCDTLHVERRADGGISRQDLGAPLPDVDLCIEAAHALRSATGCTQGAHIGLHKSLPVQAGMGGGSSDAATTLLALNRLWGLGLSRPALEKIGLALGADVPFFLRGHNARVTGVGEVIEPLAQQLPPAHFAVVKPAAGLSTKAIFSSFDQKRDFGSARIADFAAIDHGPGLMGLTGLIDPDLCRNDLQPVAQALCPEVTEAIEWLAGRGLQGRMTGSGSAVFAQMPQTDPVAPGDMDSAPEGWQVRVCGNLLLHPLAGWAADGV